ncbi:MAG: UbiH/UbiF family hydroxylase [Betaproteobacteria bacterium]|nr:UbiH/UbiF family hydroxylase [Betaproteobacteria bacterium]
MDFDVIVVGGGLVGSAFAAALQDSGFDVALVEAQPPQPPSTQDWDVRVYAISPGNQAFLARLGAWTRVPDTRVAPVQGMDVRGDGGGRLRFDALGAGLPELAFILEGGQLGHALWRGLEQQSNLTRLGGARPQALRFEDAHATIAFSDGRHLTARLIVGADGARSWVRAAAGIAAEPRAYGQLGVVANFETEKPHGHLARQWFRGDGILAFLPLPGNRISIVWSTPEPHARALLALGEAAFCERVRAAGHDALGALSLLTPPAGFPLRLLRLSSLVRPRLALIGDAAHNVHPLAGQGVNLGFHDARCLAATLKAAGHERDCGDYLGLRRYDRARKEDILAMQLVTDGLERLFRMRHPLVRWGRNLGLDLTNRQDWLKNALVRHALS